MCGFLRFQFDSSESTAVLIQIVISFQPDYDTKYYTASPRVGVQGP
jgi:hypothetical protein